MKSIEQLSIAQLAKIAGILYLLMFPLGYLGILYIPGELWQLGDASQTLANLQQHTSMARYAVASALAVQIIQMLLAVCFFLLFRGVDRVLAALILMFTLAAVPIAMMNELSLMAILNMVQAPAWLQLILPAADEVLIMFLLHLHEQGIMIAQIFWGLWMIPMGLVAWRSGFVPKWIGALLLIGALGYLVDSVIFILFPTVEFTVAEFTFMGELIFPLYLLFIGFRPHK